MNINLNASISHTSINRPVNVYSKEGIFIKSFLSPSEAKQEMFKDRPHSTGDILANCRGNQISCWGYIFQFSDDDHIIELLERFKQSPLHKQKIIQQYTLEDEFVEEFENSYQAEKALNLLGLDVRSGDIRSCCKGKQKTCRGFKFKYKE